jgi:hypothetical protein
MGHEVVDCKALVASYVYQHRHGVHWIDDPLVILTDITPGLASAERIIEYT